MYRTIQLASCIAVQGTLVRQLPNGNIVIRVGSKEFEGRPVDKKAA